MTDEPDDEPTLEPLPSIEQAVIGACFLTPEAATLALEHLRPEHFTNHNAQAAFRAIQRHAPENGAPDVVFVLDDLKSDASLNGAAAWTYKALAVPTAANQGFYVARILRDWISREERAAAGELADASTAAGKARAHQRLEAAEAVRLKLTKPLGSAATVLPFAPTGAFDLLAKKLPPIEELVVPRIIYRKGVTVLVASHKRGKSLSALGLCVDLVVNLATPFEQRVGNGAPTWLGQQIIGSGPVLVYSAEGGETMIQDRLKKMVPSPEPFMNELRVYAQKPTPQLDQKDHLEAVFAQAEAMGAILLVFDPLGRFWAMEEEGDPTAARNLMEAIQTRAESAHQGRGIAVLIVHHDTKATGADKDAGVTGGRGSGKFGDDADALINLKVVQGGASNESKAMFLLRHAESPPPVRVFIDKDTLRLKAETEEEVAVRKPPAKRGPEPKLSIENLEKCVRHYKRIHNKRIAGELGVAYQTWKNNRRDMIRDLVEGGDFMHDLDTDELAILVDGKPWLAPPERTE